MQAIETLAAAPTRANCHRPVMFEPQARLLTSADKQVAKQPGACPANLCPRVAVVRHHMDPALDAPKKLNLSALPELKLGLHSVGRSSYNLVTELEKDINKLYRS